ncbi:uncharacterized protein PG998_014657 [Apiospora kogelbergensis]|uniref:uncharacterized protein n=1 Tax=Apiospora kogelbergensis TaxID=1337665 RepID=UPI00312EA886
MDLNESQFSPSSEAGMEFYRLHILGDTRIVSILEHTYKWCALGNYRRIQEDQGHIFQLRRGGTHADVLVVQLWNAKSHPTYFRGSHKASPAILNSVRAANRMFEVALARLERAGCEPQSIPFEDGGLVIMDARVAFEMRNGSPVTFSFATADQLKSWPKLVPPTSHNTPQRVTELQKEKIGAYYVSQSLENRDE